MSCRTNCCKTFVLVLLAVAILALTAIPAFAGGICSTETSGSCLQNESCQAGVTQKLNCTANDVSVAKVINTRNPDGTPINSCVAGQTGINFVADFLVKTTATSTRSNIGLYFANFDVTAQPDALTGSCTDNVISPPHHTATVSACLGSGAYSDLTCTGFGTYDELDPNEPKSTTGTTGCGDTTSADGTVCLTANDALGNATAVPCSSNLAAQTFTATQVVTVEIKNFTCPNVAAGTQVQLPNCTSWQIPGGTIMCTTGPTDYPYPTSPPTAIEGTPSKCNCGVVSLPIIVQTPSVQVQKACTTTSTPGSGPGPVFNTVADTESPTSCDAGPEGTEQVTYTVELTNTSNTGGFTVDQICDDHFGTIYRSGSAPAGLAPCTAGTTFLGNGTDNCTGTYDLAANASTSCTFTSTPNTENLPQVNPTFTDTITAFGHGDLATTKEVSGTSDTVSVYSEDAPSTAKTTPTPTSTTNICVTERFTAVVQNTSAADETIFLHGLSDNTTDLTTGVSAAGPVVGTTCGQAVGGFGLGTLSTTAVTASNGGVFPSPAGVSLAAGVGTPPTNGGTYTCLFDVLFCGAPNPAAEEFGTGTCSTGNTGVAGTCTAGQPGTVACTSNAQCDSTCTGISHTDQLSANLTGDDTSPADTISPVTNKTSSFTQCLQEPPFVTIQ